MGCLNLAHGTGLEIAKDQPMVLLVAKTGHGGAMCRPPPRPIFGLGCLLQHSGSQNGHVGPPTPHFGQQSTAGCIHPISPTPPKENYSADPALEKIQFDTSDLAHKIEEDNWLPLQAAILVMTH
uniref:Uncharacterized protein n=1 Tax=Micrurus spixii TaxID=129469 RepID=A0A2D4N622_9SAUR